MNNPSQSESLIEPLQKRIDHFRKRAHKRYRAHQIMANRLSSMHYFIGAPNTIIASIVASTLLVSTFTDLDLAWGIPIALASILVAILTAIQTFFKFSENSERHRAASSEFSKIYRNLDTLSVQALDASNNAESIVHKYGELQADWSFAQERAPLIPDYIYDRATKEQKNDEEGI